MLMTSMPAPTNAIFAPESRSLTCFSSNLQNPLASNLQVSFSRTVPVLAAILVALCVMPAASARPLDPNTDLPGPEDSRSLLASRTDQPESRPERSEEHTSELQSRKVP